MQKTANGYRSVCERRRTYSPILLVMKLNIILLTAFLSNAAANGVAQKVSFSGKNVSMETVFNAVERQTGYYFLYTTETLEKSKPVTVTAKNLPLMDFLSAIFRSQPLVYTIASKTITVSASTSRPPGKDSIHQLFPDLFATIPIKIVDSSGNPLPAASVMIKNKNFSGITDGSGMITLSVNEGDVLLISFMGYKTKSVTVTASMIASPGTYIISLSRTVTKLDEVEVTFNTGYQQIKPEHSTGSIFTLHRKEYESRINTTNFLDGLQNKIPGLLINNDIKFEENNLFQIRGISTIGGNKNPIIIVDGYPTDLTLEMIDPNEIESVTVLKDAAAASIYGARSSNGVIIVERKKAKAGSVRVNFRSTTSLRPKEDYERYRWADNGSEIVTEFDKIKNMNAAGTLWDRQRTPQGATNYSPVALIMNHWRSNTNPITTEERDQQLAELASYNNAKDYSRLFLRTAVIQTYNLDMSGGTDRVLYYLTANYTANASTQIKNNDDIFRLSGRTNLKLSDQLSLELNTDIQGSNKRSASIPDVNAIMPYERFEDENGNPAAFYSKSKIPPIHNEYLMELGLLDNMYYPLQEMNEVSDRTKINSNRITATFRYKLANGLKFSIGGVHESANTDMRHLASENAAETRQIINYYTKPNPSGGFIYNVPKGAILKQTSGSTKGFTIRAQANYDKIIANDHALNLIAGAEVRKTIVQSNLATYFGYNDQTLINQAVDYRSITNSFAPSYANTNGALSYNSLFNHQYSDDRYISGYTNLVYSYQSRYSVTGSVRVDQSNLFGSDPKYKYKPLWSLGAAWNIHNEAFMADVYWVRSLKFRAAHGFNGNVAKFALPHVIASDNLNTLNPLMAIPNLNLLSHANSGLRWEQTRNLNLGIDYEIFKGISGSIDYYVKKSSDILAVNQIDASKGGAFANVNQASIRNSGLEINLQADWISKKQFNWNTGFVFAANTSKVLEVYNTNINEKSHSSQYVAGSYSNYLKGFAVGTLFYYRYAGLDDAGFPLIYDKDGKAKRYHTNDEGLAELENGGSSIPVLNFGLSNRVDIGNFYAYCMINYFGKFRVRVPVPNASSTRPLEGADKFWKEPGDEKDPAMLPNGTNSTGVQHYFFLQSVDKYTVNGTYFTLGDLTAAYSFRGSRFVRKLKITNLEVRAQASNLFTVALNDYNYSVATGSFAKPYMTPVYTAALSVNF